MRLGRVNIGGCFLDKSVKLKVLSINDIHLSQLYTTLLDPEKLVFDSVSARTNIREFFSLLITNYHIGIAIKLCSIVFSDISTLI